MVAITPMAAQLPRRAEDGFRADIQGLRAVAVLLVVLYHSGLALVPGGYVGVDVFFVISGFLITTHLLQSLQRDGRISLATFYARRAVRILPAAFAVILLTIGAALVWMPPLQHDDVFQWAVAAAMYAPNILAGLLSTDYLAESAPSVFQHYWSLGIEEQFYLLWPAILAVGWRMSGRSEKALFALTGLLVAVSFSLGVAVMHVSQPWAFFSLPTRGWELGVGAITAFLLRRRPAWPRRFPAGILAWVGLAGVLVAALTFDSRTPFPGYHVSLPVIATALLIVGGPGRMGPSRALSVRPLQFIGLISYSLYLVHWPLLVIPQASLGYTHPLPVWVRLSLGALAIPAAYLLFRLVEDPVRRARPLATARPVRILLASTCATALICLLAVGGTAVHHRFPLDAGRAAPATSPSPFPAGTDFVPSNLRPSLREASDDTALIYRNGCHRGYNTVDVSGCQFGANTDAPLIALFGDSHAGSWFPALHQLAQDGHIRLDSNVKSSCPSVDVPTVLNGAYDPGCHQWRAGVVHRLNAEQPDLILLANYARGKGQGSDDEFTDRWASGLARTIIALPAGSHVAVIADVPDMGQSPAICLSAHVDDADACAVPRSVALDATLSNTERTIAETVGAAYVDLTHYFCGASSCPPIIGNLLTHRDHDHLTATFSQALVSPLWRDLEPLLRR